MDEPIAIYNAVNSTNYQNMWLFFLLGGIAIGSLTIFYLLRNRFTLDRNRQLLLNMLFFFAGITCISTGAFYWITMKPVKVFPNAIETPKATIPYRSILKAEINSISQVGLLNINVSGKKIKSLTIETTDKKGYQILESEYEVQKIFNQLKQTIDQWREKEELNAN